MYSPFSTITLPDCLEYKVFYHVDKLALKDIPELCQLDRQSKICYNIVYKEVSSDLALRPRALGLNPRRAREDPLELDIKLPNLEPKQEEIPFIFRPRYAPSNEYLMFPSPETEKFLCDALSSARFELNICIPVIQHPIIFDILHEVSQRNVIVRIIMEETRQNLFCIETLRSLKVKLRVSPEEEPRSLEHIFAIIDNKVVLRTSILWTTEAMVHHFGSLHCSVERHQVEEFTREFMRLWSFFAPTPK
eukprot:TRINITY_DN1589_c0_g2_i1.p1 TRINITY_DN1589_c0_g2~~TRINITY_DN1589_c0_g2_i1.p1  ORF type:complete len:248 (-),score=29.06 TRINITY_DN1589_c0_g2_i1:105-848(-)